MGEFLCSFDMGTSGVKGGVFALDGQLIASAYKEYDLVYPRRSWAEQSIMGMWKAQCEVAHRLFDSDRFESGEIAAVAIASQRATFVPLDSRGQPLMDFISWLDHRGQDECETIRARLGDARYYEITGLAIEPTAAVSKILWLKKHAPSLFKKAGRFASAQEVHLAQLGVEHPQCDLADAGYIGLLDTDRLEWSVELLETLGLPPDKMPPLCGSGKEVGRVSREAAAATGLMEGTPVVSAGGDLQCAAVGVGVTEPGVAAVGVGTGADFVVHLEKPRRHPGRGLSCLPHAVEGAWEMEGLCLASGAVYKWFRDTFAAVEREAAVGLGIDTYDILNVGAAAVRPGSEGVLVLPSLMGSGAPHWDSDVRGAFLGISPMTDKRVLARAIMEGVCFEIRWMVEDYEALGTKLSEIRLYGGATKSHLWNQISANIYAVPVATPQIADASLLGAAICAGVGIGVFRDAKHGSQAMTRIAQRFEPESDAVKEYHELFAIFKAAYHALVGAGVFKRLARRGS